jgi:hypothetical protein
MTHVIVDAAARFLKWTEKGSNSNLILVAVTLVYVFLTNRIAKAAQRQMEGALRPALVLEIEKGL